MNRRLDAARSAVEHRSRRIARPGEAITTFDQHVLALRAALLASLGLAATACESGGAPSGGSTSTSASATSSPRVRTGPAQCDSARSYTPCAGTEADLRCKTNADCNERPVGMCASRAALPAATMRAATPAACDCIYGCSVDAECGPGELCACGAELGGSASACIPASCSSRSDCASGVCALSLYVSWSSTRSRRRVRR